MPLRSGLMFGGGGGPTSGVLWGVEISLTVGLVLWLYVHNERCIATVVVKGMNFPRNIRSISGTKVPGNERSRERIVLGTNIPAFVPPLLFSQFKHWASGLAVTHLF